MSAVEYTVENQVAVLSVTYPPVNALSLAVRTGLSEGLARALADEAVKAVVVIGGGTTFIAGADISEFGTPNSAAEPRLQTLQAAFEASAKPIIAAIHGTALGGGLELALTAHARVAIGSAKVGLPEVKLGLLPGAGGTIRLPRLTGVEVALEAITTGRHIGAVEANKLGIIDALVFDLRADAIGYAFKLANARTPPPVRDRNARITDVDPGIFADFRARNSKKWRGQIAPARIVDVIEAATTLSFADAKDFENAQFAGLMASEQRKALIHYFFAEREARKIPDVPADTKPLAVRKVVVVGSGLMGGGIAMSFANAGIAVKLLDINAEALDRGMGAVKKTYETSLGRGSISQAQMEERIGLIEPVDSYENLGDVDMAIEAVFEEMELKRSIFALLDKATPPHAILGTNTSSLDIDQIASATCRPDKVIGAHFFSPANVMKLLEAVRGAKTSAETIATVMAVGKQIGKTPILAGNCDGFIGNRILSRYRQAVDMLMLEGSCPLGVDISMRGFGMAMGPYEAQDMSGLDIAYANRKRQNLRDRTDIRYVTIADTLVEDLGRLGRKTGGGWYDYDAQGKPVESDAVTHAIYQASDKAGVTRIARSKKEIAERAFLAMIMEAIRILEEGIAARPQDIDLVMVHGFGFPRWRGGLMHAADVLTPRVILSRLEALAATDPLSWSVPALLRQLVIQGRSFDSLNQIGAPA